MQILKQKTSECQIQTHKAMHYKYSHQSNPIHFKLIILTVCTQLLVEVINRSVGISMKKLKNIVHSPYEKRRI